MDEIYVLTDANGFTTCCRPMDLMAEATRCVLMAPISVFHFQRIGDPIRRYTDWKRVRNFLWP